MHDIGNDLIYKIFGKRKIYSNIKNDKVFIKMLNVNILYFQLDETEN